MLKKVKERFFSFIIAAILVMQLIPGIQVTALNGSASYKPAESNISGKYWVSATANSGVAGNAIDGNNDTVWAPTGTGNHQLVIDLGGVYDAIYKTEVIFASVNVANKYSIEGSKDKNDWIFLADRRDNANNSGGFTDVFSYAGLRYLRLTVYGTFAVREFKIFNYLREDMDNGSDTSGFRTNTTYYNSNNNPPAPDGIRGGVMNEASVSTGNNFFGLTKDMCWDTIRLRIWNVPKHESDNSWWRDRGHNIVNYFPASQTECSPAATQQVARYVTGAGQRLAIDFHYADSWSDPQNQPKPYAWANIPWDDPATPVKIPNPAVAPDKYRPDAEEDQITVSKGLVTTVHDFTYETIKGLIDQGTPPSIVALGNEITNGMLWGSEYELTNPFADFHDYFCRFIRGRGEGDLDKDLVGTDPRGAAPKGGGVKWIRYEQALEALEEGDEEKYQELYAEFLDSIMNLSTLINAGQRAINKLNDEYDLDIETELHFAFNVFEQPTVPAGSPKVAMDPEKVYNKVMTLIGNINNDLTQLGAGMTDRIGISYYPDWHGTYGTVQRNIVELSKMLPGVKFNIAECSPSSSGSVNNNGINWMSNPNVVRNPMNDDPSLPNSFTYSTQWQGDDTINIMKLINDVPNNVGMGVWPWNGQSVYFTGGQPRASFLAFSQAFATGVVESAVYVTTGKGVAPNLPATVKELKIADKTLSNVDVVWESIDPAKYDNYGTFEVKGVANAQGNMKDVKAIVSVAGTAPAAPTGATADAARGTLRITQAALTAANLPIWAADYAGEDGLSLWYTTDGTYPSKTNGQRIRVFPAITGSGTPAAPRAYILELVGGTTYTVVAHQNGAYSPAFSYVVALTAPKWAMSNGVPMTSNGLYERSDVSDGIRLTTDAANAEIRYQIATCTYDPAMGTFSASSVDTITNTVLADSGLIYDDNNPISIEGINETTALAIRAMTKKSGAANSAAVTFKCRLSDNVLKLTADKDGNPTVDLDAFINQLSLEERVALTGGRGGDPNMLLNGVNYPIEGNNDGIARTGGPAGGTVAIPRFNIPALVLADGPAGVRMWKNATVWMAPAGLGSTWNTQILSDVGTATAEEAKHYAVDIVLGPGLNTQRNPLAGRNFEYYSEDPYITGKSAAAQVEAMQAGGVGTSLKHYAANDAESNRSRGSSNVSERALREIYLRGFEMAVEKQPWTVMCGYNAVNGRLCNADTWLNTTVLRGDWGFKGFMVSDWGADYDARLSLESQMDMMQPNARNLSTIQTWLNTNTEERMGYLNRSVKNILGVTVKTSAFRGEYGVLQPDGTYADGLKLDGTFAKGLTQEDIGLRNAAFGGSEIQKNAAKVNKQAADEAIVLMKNKDNLLPLAEGTKVALVTSRKAWNEFFNPRWYGDSASMGDVVIQGTGSAQVRFNNSTQSYSLSLKDALTDRGFNVVDWKIDFGALGGNDEAFKAAFTNNPPKYGSAKYVFSDEQSRGMAQEIAAYTAANAVSTDQATLNAKAAAAAAAASADIGIFVLTRVSGEGADLQRAAFDMEAKELIVYNAYEEAFHAAGKKLIVLINVGGTTNTTQFRESADAILDIWNPGTEGTKSIADILKGTVNPSGKLAQSFPQNFNDSPSIAMLTHPGSFNSSPAYYDEGVFVGYRYYESNPEKYESMVAYPFGYGLSYTKFEFSDLKLNKNVFDKLNPDDEITATVKVKNVGEVAGKEVVQLYLNASTWKEEGRPKNDLRAYAKTRLLNPGETETITLKLNLRDLQYFEDGNPTNDTVGVTYGNGAGWTVADGTVFTVTIRDNAENAEKPNVPISGPAETFKYGSVSGEVYGSADITSNYDGSVNARISLVNESDKEANALLIYAIYDSEGRLTGTSANPVTASALKNSTLNVKISGLDTGSTVKAFVWRMPSEGFTGAYLPICEAVEYQN